MRTFVISDIHGAYKALLQVFEKSKIDYEYDKLIVLGDVFDGWPEIKECFEELSKFKNIVYVVGNHDVWALEHYMFNKPITNLWYSQGGHATIQSFGDELSVEAIDFLKKIVLYYEDAGMLFVHAGFDLFNGLKVMNHSDYYWDRTLAYTLFSKSYDLSEIETLPIYNEMYSKIFIGHTPTIKFNSTIPLTKLNVRLIDTGASYDGPLTLVDVNSEEIWQSDPVYTFYPNIKPRGYSLN